MKKTLLGSFILLTLVLSGCGDNHTHTHESSKSPESHVLTKVGDKTYDKSQGNIQLLSVSNKSVSKNIDDVDYNISSVKLLKTEATNKNQESRYETTFGDKWESPMKYIQVKYTLTNNTDHPIFIWGAGGIDGSGTQYDNNDGAHDSLQGKTLQPGAKMEGLLLYKATSSDKDNFDKEKMVTGLVDIKSGDKDIKTIDNTTIDLTK